MKLEELIKEKAAAFEDTPSKILWQNIEAQLQEKPKSSVWVSKKFKIFASAAVLFCCLGLGYLLGIKSNKPQSYAENMPEMAQQNAEFVMFTQNLDEKKAVFNKLISEQPALEEVFAKDLNALDQDYQALKSQIQVSPNKEQLLNAMIENLRFQEQILNTQTRILEKTNKNKNLDIL
jgi:septal ring factor EnvC (AmiA/AmiB activator)